MDAEIIFMLANTVMLVTTHHIFLVWLRGDPEIIGTSYTTGLSFILLQTRTKAERKCYQVKICLTISVNNSEKIHRLHSKKKIKVFLNKSKLFNVYYKTLNKKIHETEKIL